MEKGHRLFGLKEKVGENGSGIDWVKKEHGVHDAHR